MTMFTAPPDQSGLTLRSGDELDINQGGTATDTVVQRGAQEVVVGGDAVKTILVGGVEFVDSGKADAVTFEGVGSALSVADPTSLQGILTFDGVNSSIVFGTPIDSISSTFDTLTVTYGDNKTITYDYITSGETIFSLSKAENRIMVDTTGLLGAPPPGHSPPPEQVLHHHFTDELHAPRMVGVLHLETTSPGSNNTGMGNTGLPNMGGGGNNSAIGEMGLFGEPHNSQTPIVGVIQHFIGGVDHSV